MSNRYEEIKSAFESLLGDSGQPGQRVHTRIDKSAPIKIHAACKFPQKNLMIEIGPISNAWLPMGFQKPRIKGLEITLKSNDKKPDGDVTLLLELLQLEAVDVFTVFAARVCEELDSLSKPKTAVRSVIALIEKWKDFFSGNTGILSDERQTGLYGELFLIEHFFLKDVEVGKVVHAWTGSKKTSQDFEFGSVAVEVKASAAVDTNKVNITNIRQLDDTGLQSLFLARVLFDARQGAEKTLPAIIDTISQAIEEKSPESLLDFKEKLFSAGYRDEHEEHYKNRTYSKRGIFFYKVADGFPRLLEGNLPGGVTKASYEITLEACQSFTVEDEMALYAVRNCND